MTIVCFNPYNVAIALSFVYEKVITPHVKRDSKNDEVIQRVLPSFPALSLFFFFWLLVQK